MKSRVKCELHELLYKKKKKKITFFQRLIRYINLEIFLLSVLVEDLFIGAL
jgi:hypothetical protein